MVFLLVYEVFLVRQREYLRIIWRWGYSLGKRVIYIIRKTTRLKAEVWGDFWPQPCDSRSGYGSVLAI
jgi:hypothetical protein